MQTVNLVLLLQCFFRFWSMNVNVILQSFQNVCLVQYERFWVSNVSWPFLSSSVINGRKRSWNGHETVMKRSWNALYTLSLNIIIWVWERDQTKKHYLWTLSNGIIIYHITTTSISWTQTKPAKKNRTGMHRQRPAQLPWDRFAHFAGRIPYGAIKARPICELLKKGRKYEMSELQREAFKKLKESINGIFQRPADGTHSFSLTQDPKATRQCWHKRATRMTSSSDVEATVLQSRKKTTATSRFSLRTNLAERSHSVYKGYKI